MGRPLLPLWKVDSLGDVVTEEHGKVVCDVPAYSSPALARLIAATPRLYAALRALEALTMNSRTLSSRPKRLSPPAATSLTWRPTTMDSPDLAALKARIDEMSYEDMLSLWRFAPVGHPMFSGETGTYFAEQMARRRDSDPEGHVAASKRIGW